MLSQMAGGLFECAVCCEELPVDQRAVWECACVEQVHCCAACIHRALESSTDCMYCMQPVRSVDGVAVEARQAPRRVNDAYAQGLDENFLEALGEDVLAAAREAERNFF